MMFLSLSLLSLVPLSLALPTPQSSTPSTTLSTPYRMFIASFDCDATASEVSASPYTVFNSTLTADSCLQITHASYAFSPLPAVDCVISTWQNTASCEGVSALDTTVLHGGDPVCVKGVEDGGLHEFMSVMLACPE